MINDFNIEVGPTSHSTHKQAAIAFATALRKVAEALATLLANTCNIAIEVLAMMLQIITTRTLTRTMKMVLPHYKDSCCYFSASLSFFSSFSSLFPLFSALLSNFFPNVTNWHN